MALPISELKVLFDNFLTEQKITDRPENLYKPVNYIMDIGGKRIRPLSTLIAYNIYSDEFQPALSLAYAFEIFHNFTLAHDDVMDDADIRRGKKAMHIAYGLNSAILSGDVMMIYAYRYIDACTTNADLKVRLYKLFTDTAIQICEGQQMDMDFETQKEVELSDYLLMIKLKTAVLLAACLKAGALLGGASETDADHIYAYGLNLGLAFQIQDDVLDLYGEKKGFGKKIGGDILQKKKTFLYLKALELLDNAQRVELKMLYNSDETESAKKILKVKEIFDALEIKDHATMLMNELTENATAHLGSLKNNRSELIELKGLGDMLLLRKV